MATMPLSHPYSSPKRKRGDACPTFEGSSAISPSALRLDTNLHRYPFPHLRKPSTEQEDASPRSTVAGHFQTLAIEGTAEHDQNQQHGNKRFALMSCANKPSESKTQPSTNLPEGRSHIFRPPTAEHFNFESVTPSAISERPRDHTRSPPLGGDVNDQYWHESEITGLDPLDPNDDGYGINGIGFRPTPAIAWQRAQKRKQQLAEYKSREAREARQRRSERRKVASTKCVGDDDFENTGPQRPRVRFDDG